MSSRSGGIRGSELQPSILVLSNEGDRTGSFGGVKDVPLCVRQCELRRGELDCLAGLSKIHRATSAEMAFWGGRDCTSAYDVSKREEAGT